jgi:F0F1-type ATP synthase assembly protein I
MYSPCEYKPQQVMRWLVGPIPACFVLLAYRLQWAMDELAGEMILRLPEYAFIQIYSNMRMLICKSFVSLDPAKHLTCLVSLMEQS